MSRRKLPASPVQNIILVVEDNVMVRTALSEYLRDCGYRVIEAAGEQEAMQVFSAAGLKINIIFIAIVAFNLVQWVRRNHPGVQVVLAGNVEKAAHAAGELCEQGPHLKKPYDPQHVIGWIRRLQLSKPR